MRLLFTILAMLMSVTGLAQATHWQLLAKGLDYAAIDTSTDSVGKLHAFRIDLNQYNVDLALAQDSDPFTSTVKRLADQNEGIIAINGGFFSPERVPLGLRIQDGKIRHPLKTSTSWWGVFYVENHHAFIQPPKSFTNKKGITFAVQAGPRLLIDGNIPNLKENFDQRSALCITNTGKVVIAATDNAPISTLQLATLLKKSSLEGGLDCQNALNLDGGTSTQLYANIGGFYLSIPSFMPIADAIIVRAKNAKTILQSSARGSKASRTLSANKLAASMNTNMNTKALVNGHQTKGSLAISKRAPSIILPQLKVLGSTPTPT